MKKSKLLKIVIVLLMITFVLGHFQIARATNSNNTETEDENAEYVTFNVKTQQQTNQNFEDNSIPSVKHTDSYIPNIRTIMPMSIIGGDERKKVNDPSQFPYSTVAYMEAYFPDGHTAYGTAFVIYNDLALTAGHCVYNPKFGGWAKSVTIWPGKNGFGAWNNPYGTAKSNNIHISTDFYNNQTNSEDWALIELDSKIGDKCGWRGIAYSEDYSCFDNKNVTVAGYPKSNQYYQYQATGPVKMTHAKKLFYDIDTEGGQSGSPVWDSAGYSIGIHTYGTESGAPWNSCSNITKDRFQFFKSKMD